MGQVNSPEGKDQQQHGSQLRDQGFTTLKRGWHQLLGLRSRNPSAYLVGALLPVGLLAVTLVNTFVGGPTPVNPTAGADGRGLASVAPSVGRGGEARLLEKGLLQQLSNKERPTLAIVGRQPSSLDHLLYGRLEGLYAAQIRHGKIHELTFSAESRQTGKPKLIVDRSDFLMQNQGLLPFEFKTTNRVSSQNVQGDESYELRDAEERVLGRVHFTFDHLGRLLTMKIDNSSQN